MGLGSHFLDMHLLYSHISYFIGLSNCLTSVTSRHKFFYYFIIIEDYFKIKIGEFKNCKAQTELPRFSFFTSGDDIPLNIVIAISFDESGDNATMVFKQGFFYFLFFELIFLEN